MIDGVPIAIRRIAKLFCQSKLVDDCDDAMIAGQDLERLGWLINGQNQYVPPEALIFGWVYLHNHAFWIDLNRAQAEGKVVNDPSTEIGSLMYQCWICCWAPERSTSRSCPCPAHPTCSVPHPLVPRTTPDLSCPAVSDTQSPRSQR